MPTVRVNGITMLPTSSPAQEQPLVLHRRSAGSTCPTAATSFGALAERPGCSAFDNRRAGRTDKPDAPYTIAQMAGDTPGRCERLGVAQADIVGISMGGRIALELALNDPGLVRSLILASTSARVSRRCACGCSVSSRRCLRCGAGTRSRATPSGASARRARL